MTHRRNRVAALVVAVVTLLISQLSVANASGGIRASLDGEASIIDEAARHHCLAVISGSLDCFSSMEVRDAKVGQADSSELLLAGYVIAYHDISFGGASVVLSTDYANLGSIGWNDRISSYKVFSTQTGQFHHGTSYTGAYQSFCCYWEVTYVGDSHNDTFSSVDVP